MVTLVGVRAVRVFWRRRDRRDRLVGKISREATDLCGTLVEVETVCWSLDPAGEDSTADRRLARHDPCQAVR
jgi:hypothetical protein